MLKTINGIRYNTKTAEAKIYEQSSRAATSPFWWSATLYQTPRGNWFVHGVGNALSPYAVNENGRRVPGERILVIDEETAREWMLTAMAIMPPVPIGGEQ